MTDRFHYDTLVDDALRGVVYRVLKHVAEKGLPGSHHFYISFRSTDPGVQLPDYLRAKYPDEMTIVLQHQYWDLTLTEDFFEVTVSFNKRPERVKVPFTALSAFVDPSVRFGLQFDGKDKGPAAERPAPAPAGTTLLPVPEKRSPSDPAPDRGSDESQTDTAAREAPAPETPDESASKIVKLDSFRKK
jgi:hypothetical protein